MTDECKWMIVGQGQISAIVRESKHRTKWMVDLFSPAGLRTLFPMLKGASK